MPPMEGPRTQRTRGIPSDFNRPWEAVATSSNVRVGNPGPKDLPLRGSRDEGPVEPKQLPSEFTQMTWKRSVLMDLSGPSISSHQPGVGSSPLEAAWAEGERPVNINSTLSLAAFSLPQDS